MSWVARYSMSQTKKSKFDLLIYQITTYLNPVIGG